MQLDAKELERRERKDEDSRKRKSILEFNVQLFTVRELGTDLSLNKGTLYFYLNNQIIIIIKPT
jgi:hypothetical protein